MKILLFSKRNSKEIIRDIANLFFGLGFPIIMLLLFTLIDSALPEEANNDMFSIDKIGPGISAFGTAFFALFAGILLAKDRTTSFLMRLFASPMTSFDFIAGYTLPLLVMALVQGCITFLASATLGLPLTVTTPLAVLTQLPISFLYIGIGLLCGSFLSEKAVGGICGALLTNIGGWFSGVWIPLDLIGGAFKKTANILPFYHSVEAAKAALNGSYKDILSHLAVVLIYAVIIYALAVFVFSRRMRDGKA